jgi:hypothetical protein
LWELLAPYIICLLLLPLIVKARVKDAYAGTRAIKDWGRSAKNANEAPDYSDRKKVQSESTGKD